MQALFQEARGKLETAVKSGSLAPWKVGTWLKRIFESNADQAQIKEFLGGKMNILMHNWSDVRKQFDKIEQLRQNKGTPRSFHFVHLNLFLSWDFAKRKSYVEEAQRRFTDIEKERYNFLLIRHSLDSKDWDEARELISQEKRHTGEMTEAERAKLTSLESFLRAHEPKKSEGKEKKTKTDAEVLTDMRQLMEKVPETLRPLHTACVRKSIGAVHVLKKTCYNLKWCNDHMWYSEKLRTKKQQEAEEYTPDRIENGHERGFEANDVTGANNERAAIRDQKSKRGPQWLYVNNGSSETLAEEFHKQQNNRNFWYWTSLVPKELPYSKHEEMVVSTHTKLMSVAREMDKRNIYYTHSGDVSYKNLSLKEKKEPQGKKNDTPSATAA
jgi:hypothetical protein